MTPQEIFNDVAIHLAVQREPAATYNGANNGIRCLYRKKTPYGILKCAAGIFIPDKVYNINMDKAGPVDGLVEEWYKVLPKDIFNSSNKNILKGVQNVHDNQDNWKSRETMVSALTKLAEKHNLDSSILSTVFPENWKPLTPKGSENGN